MIYVSLLCDTLYTCWFVPYLYDTAYAATHMMYDTCVRHVRRATRRTMALQSFIDLIWRSAAHRYGFLLVFTIPKSGSSAPASMVLRWKVVLGTLIRHEMVIVA